MAEENHIIKALYAPLGYCRTKPAFQYDYGQILRLEGFETLPQAFEMHFAAPGGAESITQIGFEREVTIPNECFKVSGVAKAWLFLHDTETDGETRYVINIPVEKRATITDIQPEPKDVEAIAQAITVLNNAIDITNNNVEQSTSLRDETSELTEETRTLRDETEGLRDEVSELAEETRQNKNIAVQSAEDAQQAQANSEHILEQVQQEHSAVSEIADNVANIQTNVQNIQTDVANKANEARQSASNAANSASAGQQILENNIEVRDEIIQYKNEVVSNKNSVSQTKTEVDQISGQVREDAQIAADAREVVENFDRDFDAAMQNVYDTQQAVDQDAEEAKRYALLAKDYAYNSDMSATKSATQAVSSKNYADLARAYAASAENYSKEAKDAQDTTIGYKEDVEEILTGQNNVIANVDSGAADRTYQVGELFLYNSQLYRATKVINRDESFVPGFNCESTIFANEILNAQDRIVFDTMPTENSRNPVTSGGIYNALTNINSMKIHVCLEGEYADGTPTVENPDPYTFYLVPGGNTPNLYVEWVYVDGDWEQFGSATIDLSNYVQKTDYATDTEAGVIKVTNADVASALESQAGGSVLINGKLFYVGAPAEVQYRVASNHAALVSTANQHLATFYGLAKAAGDSTQKGSNNAAGQYTDEAKAAIQNMLDVPSNTDLSSKADKADTVLDTTLSRGRKANTTVGGASMAFGVDAEASGYYSVALGLNTTASSQGAFAEGKNTVARYIAHAEGEDTQALGQWAHSQGVGTIAKGAASFAGGDNTIANGHSSFVTGRYNAADSYDNWAFWAANTSYAVGDKVKREQLVNNEPTIIGYICKEANTDETFDISHWDFDSNHMNYSVIVGNGYEAEDPETHQIVRHGSNAYALDWDGNEHIAGDVYVHSNADSTGGTKLAKITDIPDTSIYATKADTVLESTLSRGRKEGTTVGTGSFAFGNSVEASGSYSHAEGNLTNATGWGSHTEGSGTSASGQTSHAEGSETSATGAQSHAEGLMTYASSYNAHAEGNNNAALGDSSHAEGSAGYGNNFYLTGSANSKILTYSTTSKWDFSKVPMAIGYNGIAAYIESIDTENKVVTLDKAFGVDLDNTQVNMIFGFAKGPSSHIEGYTNIAMGNNQHVQGKFNAIDKNNKYADIVGNGTMVDTDSRSNAYALEWTGTGRYAGDVYVGCNNDSTGGTKLATITELATKLDAAEAGLKVVRLI